MLTRAVEVVKQNPWKITLGTIGTVVFSLVGILFSDARYVHQDKAALEKAALEKAAIMQSIQDLQKQVKELSNR
jgi:hypothetical protein